MKQLHNKQEATTNEYKKSKQHTKTTHNTLRTIKNKQ